MRLYKRPHFDYQRAGVGISKSAIMMINLYFINVKQKNISINSYIYLEKIRFYKRLDSK